VIPLKDINTSSTRPVVNTLLVAINVIAFFYELSLGRDIEQFLRQFGVVPVDIMGDQTVSLFDRVRPLVTSMFLHGGWLHLIGNMLFLWVFGDNVEDRFGHFRYLLFYLAGGFAASLAHILFNADSTVPTIGASGAVAAVLGAYSFLFPGARVLALVPLGFFLQTMEIPAKLFLGLWFVLQFLSGATSLAVSRAAQAGGVAWWAHIGGFLFGFLLALAFYRDRRRRVAPAW
jgi:membrane associated rhomboid family serine protease